MNPPTPRVVVIMPVYNDSRSAAVVLADLDRVLAPLATVSVLVVDDASTPRVAPEDLRPSGSALRLSVLRLRRNLGHQRAIAVGLAYAADHFEADAVIVMDADGEDRVEDVPRLMEGWREARSTSVVFASRMRRSESALFRLLYHTYRGLHWLLTGIPVRFGNFSVIPWSLLPGLVVSSDLWNHYAASVLKAKLPYTSVPAARGRRVAGQSQMNFPGLVMHGLSALSVFGDIVGVRLLVFSVCAFALMSLVAVLGVAAYASGVVHVPDWALVAGGFGLAFGFETLVACSLLALVVLGRRAAADFIPSRDYPLFVESVSESSPLTT